MTIFIYIALLIIQFSFAAFILFLLVAFITGGPYVPTKMTTARAMVEAARITEGMTVYDIGSGDGRLLFLAAREGAEAVGIEINPFLVWFTNVRALLSPYRNHVRAAWKNLWKTPLTEADAVFVYLIPWKMGELENKLYKELKKGSLIVTNSFVFPGKKPIRTNTQHHVYVYRV